jgi:hypothetical protein
MPSRVLDAMNLARAPIDRRALLLSAAALAACSAAPAAKAGPDRYAS